MNRYLSSISVQFCQTHTHTHTQKKRGRTKWWGKKKRRRIESIPDPFFDPADELTVSNGGNGGQRPTSETTLREKISADQSLTGRSRKKILAKIPEQDASGAPFFFFFFFFFFFYEILFLQFFFRVLIDRHQRQGLLCWRWNKKWKI